MTTTYHGASGAYGAPEALAAIVTLWFLFGFFMAPGYAATLAARLKHWRLCRRNRRAVAQHARSRRRVDTYGVSA